MSVFDNMAFGLKLRKTPRNEIERRVKEAADILDIGNLLDRKPKQLSGGQRQRLSIARAILKNAPILILDEATSAVDTETERAIQQSLNQLIKGKTAIIIAHRLSTIRWANQILVLDQGTVVENGTHEELIEQKGIYADLWKVQIGEMVLRSADDGQQT